MISASAGVSFNVGIKVCDQRIRCKTYGESGAASNFLWTGGTIRPVHRASSSLLFLVFFHEALGLRNRTIHVLDQLGDINLDFGGFPLQRADRLRIQVMLKEEHVIVELGQHRLDAPFGPRGGFVEIMVALLR